MINLDQFEGHSDHPFKEIMGDIYDKDDELVVHGESVLFDKSDKKRMANTALIMHMSKLLEELKLMRELVEAQDKVLDFLALGFSDRMTYKQLEQHDYLFTAITTLKERLEV